MAWARLKATWFCPGGYRIRRGEPPSTPVEVPDEMVPQLPKSAELVADSKGTPISDEARDRLLGLNLPVERKAGAPVAKPSPGEDGGPMTYKEVLAQEPDPLAKARAVLAGLDEEDEEEDEMPKGKGYPRKAPAKKRGK